MLKRARRVILLSFLAFTLIPLGIVLVKPSYFYIYMPFQRKFDSNLWKKADLYEIGNIRFRMLRSLLHRHEIQGMDEAQLLRLIGPGNDDISHYKKRNLSDFGNRFYWLGPSSWDERDGSGSSWLILKTDRSKVTDYGLLGQIYRTVDIRDRRRLADPNRARLYRERVTQCGPSRFKSPVQCENHCTRLSKWSSCYHRGTDYSGRIQKDPCSFELSVREECSTCRCTYREKR